MSTTKTKTAAAQGVVRKFLTSVVPGIVKPLHALWNEVIGFLFIVLGLLSARPVWQAYHEGDVVKFLLSGFFGIVMLSFGVHGFWKARKITRS